MIGKDFEWIKKSTREEDSPILVAPRGTGPAHSQEVSDRGVIFLLYFAYAKGSHVCHSGSIGRMRAEGLFFIGNEK
jgi:hypothetical protein